jgi:beta-phosphoglucomutase-like phosphatase (HAD superfamily)
MPPELVIFDCDGVLIDSEGIASMVVAENLTAHGWPMTADEAETIFIGMSIQDMQPMIEAHLGRPLGPAWRTELAARLVTALAAGARPIPGAHEILTHLNERGIPWRVASNSSDEEMNVKFARTGMSDIVAGRLYSAGRIIAAGGRPKPAPDIYLTAARDAGVDPAQCLVIEDSVVGVTAAAAAGMRVLGLAPHGDGAPLRAAGAAGTLRHLNELAGVLA